MDKQAIRQAWKAYLARHALSQSGLAAKVGISNTVVSNYVNANFRPSPETMERIAQATGEDPQVLRKELYPDEADADLSEAPNEQELPEQVVEVRLACLEVAAGLLEGAEPVDAATVAAFAEQLESWVLRVV